MINILIAIHVLVAASIVILVLVQHGKGADAGAAFGGGGGGASGSLFGSQGSANFLSRTTAVLATVFFLTSLSLTFLYSQSIKTTSVTDSVIQDVQETAPEKTETMPAIPAGNLEGLKEAIPAIPASSDTTTSTTDEPGLKEVPVVPGDIKTKEKE